MTDATLARKEHSEMDTQNNTTTVQELFDAAYKSVKKSDDGAIQRLAEGILDARADGKSTAEVWKTIKTTGCNSTVVAFIRKRVYNRVVALEAKRAGMTMAAYRKHQQNGTGASETPATDVQDHQETPSVGTVAEGTTELPNDGSDVQGDADVHEPTTIPATDRGSGDDELVRAITDPAEAIVHATNLLIAAAKSAALVTVSDDSIQRLILAVNDVAGPYAQRKSAKSAA